MGVEVTPDDMLRNLEADLEWLINGPVQSVLVAELRACAMAAVRRAIAAEAEADRLRNILHAQDLENRTLREDVKGIIDRECQTLGEELVEARAEATRLRTLIERDRTGLAAGLAEVRKIVGGYGWLAREDEWGSYEYHERTVKALRQEMADCIDQVEAAAMGALQASGRRVTEAFRPAPPEEGGGS